tara:strand:- start:3019 stop:3933 length:915 start_codon:yes stop_codon:yes gene_type:complete
MNYEWAEKYRQESEQMHWVTDEIDFNQDMVDFREKLTNDERDFVKSILSIFTQSDEEVANFYLDFLLPKVKNNEIRGMLSSFNNREWEHQRGYAQLNETLGLPESYYTDFMEHTATLAKYNFYVDNENIGGNFGLALAKQILTEGIALFGAFIMLKNFERHGLLMGTCKVNEWSLKDETLHVEGNAKLFRVWASENSKEIDNKFKKVIYDMTREVVDLECKFIDFAFNKHEVRELYKEEVKEYVRYIADRRLAQLGLKSEYNIKDNPLPWFDMLTNGSSLQNFFEGRSADYDIAGLTGDWRYND